MLGNSKARDIGKLIATPFAKIFIKLGFSPDLVTLFGTLGVVASSIVFFSQGEFLAGSILFAMFVGGVVAPTAVAIVVAAWLGEGNSIVQWPVVPGSYGVFVLLAFAVTLLLANYGLQYGASRLPANVTSVVMLSEVVFATLSAIVLTDEVLTLQVGVGGSMILVAAALSALNSNSAH